MGLDYRYLEEGNDTKKLVQLFESVKDIDHPIVLHIHTIKGKGLKYAEEAPERWHAGGAFNVNDGSLISTNGNNDTTVFDSLKNLLNTNEKAAIVSAGTPMVLGFTEDKRDEYVLRGQFFDVGIAEENAVAICSGIAKNGGTAVFGTLAPFFQRTYDQISHDLCLNNSPATMLILSPGVYGMNSDTHLALCDIQMFAHIPNFVYLAPATKNEYLSMFKFATTQKEKPIGIRVPSYFIETNLNDNYDYSTCNKNKILLNGSKVAIFAVGQMVKLALDIAKMVKEKMNLDITVINPMILSELDIELLNSLKENHNFIITLEDGELVGGYGMNIASFYGNDKILVKNYGISKKFHTDFIAEKLLEENGMSVDKIFNEIKKIIV